jgi:hypothetical protein
VHTKPHRVRAQQRKRQMQATLRPRSPYFSTLWRVTGLMMLVVVLMLSLSGCGTPQIQARVVYQAPPRPDASLLERPHDVPLLTAPIDQAAVLLKHADEAFERHTLAAQLNGLIDYVLKVTE